MNTTPDGNPSYQSLLSVARPYLDWVQQLSPDQAAQAEALPVRRDMVTLLTYVRDNKVTCTHTGNLPLKAVREVTARFVDPPQLDETIGDHTYRLRTEFDVWPLYFLHTIADVGGLLYGGPARRLQLSSNGAQFLAETPPFQVWFMLAVWCLQTNWLIAYPLAGMGEELPPHFQELTLAHLRALPVGTRIDYEPFADRLIQETGLKWAGQDKDSVRWFLHVAIERMVMNILANFGIVEKEYQDKLIGSSTFKDLAAIQITSFGKGLLQSFETLDARHRTVQDSAEEWSPNGEEWDEDLDEDLDEEWTEMEDEEEWLEDEWDQEFASSRSIEDMRRIALDALRFGDDDAEFYTYAAQHGLTVNEIVYYLNAYEAGGDAGLQAIRCPDIIPPNIAQQAIKTIAATLDRHFEGRMPYRLTDEGTAIGVYEIQERWQSNEKYLFEICQFRLTLETNQWHLYWFRKFDAWWPYPLPETGPKYTLKARLQQVLEDRFGCFWG